MTNMSKEGCNYIRNKSAFTLAEVLITLGIIGVVAAMTIPNLMTAFAKHRVETQLLKFYSTMNQAMRMSVADNGTPEGWITTRKSYSYNEVVEFLETYISPYLKHSNYKRCDEYGDTGAFNTITACVSLLSGGVVKFYIDGNGSDIYYFIDGDLSNTSTKNRFKFQFSKNTGKSGDDTINSQNFIEPYIWSWDGTDEDLKNNTTRGCYKDCEIKGSSGNFCAYCAKVIQLNSWKIPDDYPW